MNQDQFYAVRQARAWLEEKPVYLDTETTGLSSTDEIIEIALIDDQEGTLIVVKPTVPISAAASDIHGLTDADVAHMPSFAEMLPKLAKLVKRRLILIYNSTFDLRLLEQSAEAHRARLPSIRAACVMRLYAWFHGERNDHRQSYKWQSQANAARQLNLELPADLHRAAADARLCKAIVEAMAATPLPGEE